MDPEFDGVLEGDEFVVDGGMAPDPFDVVFSAMPILIGLFAMMFVAVVVLMVVTATRKARRYREAGIDPLTADVERLYASGRITSVERDAARATLLGTL